MKTLSVITLGMLVLGAASAQSSKAAKLFSDLDVNQNGQIDVREAEADRRVLESFNRMDANRDGLLSREEFSSLDKLQQ